MSLQKLKPIKIPETYKYAEAFLTLKCNLSCKYCINTFDSDRQSGDGFDHAFDRKRWKELDGSLLAEGINRLEFPKGMNTITLGGGEPALHPEFIEIINCIRSDIDIDILTNLTWSPRLIKEFLSRVDPKRLNRGAPYPNMRVSYHPTEHELDLVVERAKLFQDAGFSIGIYSVPYPSPENIAAVYKAQFACIKAGVMFRLKEFIGEYRSVMYGTFKYPEVLSKHYADPEHDSRAMIATADCKTTELLIAPDGKVHRCHSDLYSRINSIGHILDPTFQLEDKYRYCTNVVCNLCDIKLKTDSKQELGHAAVSIQNLQYHEQKDRLSEVRAE